MPAEVLYLDKMSSEMEQILIKMCPDNIEMKFLQPSSHLGTKGSIEEAEYVLVTNYIVSKDIIDKTKSLKMIQRTGVGVDNVDTAYAREKSIPVSITLGTNASSVAELVIGMILSLYRRIHILNNRAKEGYWDTWTFRHESYEILGKIIGIIGVGAIGIELIKRLKGFLPDQIIYNDLNRLSEEEETALGVSYKSLDYLLESCDVISLHVPWLESTRGLIGRNQIAKMKSNAILINTARGPIVDQDALVEAVKNGKIGGAGLDVFDPEPFTKDCDVMKHENIITTSHVGAATLDNYERVFDFCFQNITRLENGENPENVINEVSLAATS